MGNAQERQQAIDKVMDDLAGSGLPEQVRAPLHDSLQALLTERPSALNQLVTLAQAIRTPRRLNLWQRAAQTLPGGAAYADLRQAVDGVIALWKAG